MNVIKCDEYFKPRGTMVRSVNRLNAYALPEGKERFDKGRVAVSPFDVWALVALEAEKSSIVADRRKDDSLRYVEEAPTKHSGHGKKVNGAFRVQLFRSPNSGGD